MSAAAETDAEPQGGAESVATSPELSLEPDLLDAEAVPSA